MAIGGSWSTEAVREYILALLSAHDKRYEQRFEAMQKSLDNGFSGVERSITQQRETLHATIAAADRAVTKAESIVDKRFDQQHNLIPRAEVASITQGLTEKILAAEKENRIVISGLSEKLDVLTKKVDRLNSDHVGHDKYSYTLVVVIIVLTILGLLALALKILP
jgi:hypothetical protein